MDQLSQTTGQDLEGRTPCLPPTRVPEPKPRTQNHRSTSVGNLRDLLDGALILKTWAGGGILYYTSGSEGPRLPTLPLPTCLVLP